MSRHVGPTNSNVIDMQAAIDRYRQNLPEPVTQPEEKPHYEEWSEWFKLLCLGVLTLWVVLAVTGVIPT